MTYLIERGKALEEDFELAPWPIHSPARQAVLAAWTSLADVAFITPHDGHRRLSNALQA
jgi:hypothetical protein